MSRSCIRQRYITSVVAAGSNDFRSRLTNTVDRLKRCPFGIIGRTKGKHRKVLADEFQWAMHDFRGGKALGVNA